MIVVPTPELDSPAARALRMEGLEPVECFCPVDTHYGLTFARLWDKGDPFVIVEWDVIPWPGAVTRLLDCPEPWCTHRYPLHQGNVTTSFGIGKYAPHGPAPAEWRETPWHQLDGQVVPHLREKLATAPHVHEPPVAHARRAPEPHANPMHEEPKTYAGFPVRTDPAMDPDTFRLSPPERHASPMREDDDRA